MAQPVTPEFLARNNTEHGHQAAFFCWAQREQYRCAELAVMFAIPNGGSRGASTGGMLKAEGVKAGVPDIFMAVSRHGLHGLFIEMKRPHSSPKVREGKKQQNQDVWGSVLHGQGYAVAVCYTWEQARDCVCSYLGIAR